MNDKKRPVDLKTMQGWVDEAFFAAREWRTESWVDCEFFDGGLAQWTQEEYNKAKAYGIDPLTINRTFPIINMLRGAQIFNKTDMIAKGRTPRDSELGNTVSEGVKFVLDQWDGEFLLSELYKELLVPGIGWGAVGYSQDPRKEKVKIGMRPWTEMWVDPFSPPFVSPDHTKYLFHGRFVDLDELKDLWPEKSKDLEEVFNDCTAAAATTSGSGMGMGFGDPQELIEDERLFQSGWSWTQRDRKRLRPVEMWFPRFERRHFAIMADGRVMELDLDDGDPMQVYQLINAAEEVVTASVKKMWTCTFVGSLILQYERSPFRHDEYPFVPFIGYVSRFGYPYGVPRQIRGQNKEVNRRRSMALALLTSRRVITESDIVDDGATGSKDGQLNKIWQEANKPDGFVVVGPGKLEKIKIQEHTELERGQVDLMQQSEQEIQEISGANAERLGQGSPQQSGVAQQYKIQQSNVMTASLTDSFRRSQKAMGNLIIAGMQHKWPFDKVLRITDRMSGAEKFLTLNERVLGPGGEVIEVKNDITQSIFDLVVAEAPMTDLAREKFLDLIMAWIQKAPPEVAPLLITLGFELSDVPNKEILMAKIRTIFGEDPAEADLDPDQIKALMAQKAMAQQQAQAEAADMAKQKEMAEIQKLLIENEKTRMEMNKIQEEMKKTRADTVDQLLAQRAAARQPQPNAAAGGKR